MIGSSVMSSLQRRHRDACARRARRYRCRARRSDRRLRANRRSSNKDCRGRRCACRYAAAPAGGGPSGATAMPLTSSGGQSGKLTLTSTSLRHAVAEHAADDVGRKAQAGLPDTAACRCATCRTATARSTGMPSTRAFHGAGDGAGIDHVLADIAAAIDARQHEIELLAVEHVTHAHDDAIGRRAAHRDSGARRPGAAAADR